MNEIHIHKLLSETDKETLQTSATISNDLIRPRQVESKLNIHKSAKIQFLQIVPKLSKDKKNIQYNLYIFYHENKN